MELQSAKVNLQSASSLPVAGSVHQLDSTKYSASQAARSNERSLASTGTPTSHVSQLSSVVSKLVTGPQASAAVYSELTATTDRNASELSQLKAAANTSEKAVNSQASESENLAKKNQRESAELDVVRQLSAIDRKVKAHEQTHAAIGGSFAGAPSFDFTSGPDGQLYATSGEVAIDTSPIENDPKATLEKAQVIIRAALSVADPSPADRQIAAEGKSLAMKAMSQLGGQSEVSGVEQDSSKVAQVQAQIEEQQLERKEYLAEQELKKAKQERNEALIQTRNDSKDASIEVLREYNVQINEIQETLRRLNTQLVDSGAFEKLFPEGALVDQSV
jgi:hypothetical protein